MFDRILVALDGPGAALLLPVAEGLARAHHAHLQLCCVVDPGYVLSEPDDGVPDAADETEYPAAATEQEEADGLLRNAVARLRAAGLEADGAVCPGDPVPAILEAARQDGSGLILLGHRHRSWLGRLSAGSVCATLLERASCPVLVVSGAG